REVEARVVRDEDGIACELEEASHRDCRMRCTAQVGIAQPRQRRDRRADRRAGVDEELELVLELQFSYAHRADLTDPRAAGAEAGRLQVDDDERRALEL